MNKCTGILGGLFGHSYRRKLRGLFSMYPFCKRCKQYKIKLPDLNAMLVAIYGGKDE